MSASPEFRFPNGLYKLTSSAIFSSKLGCVSYKCAYYNGISTVFLICLNVS